MGEDAIKESFKRVKEDFERRDLEISRLRQELETLKSQVNSLLPELLATNRAILKRLDSFEARISPPRDPLREQVLKSYSKRRKELVMNRILELVAERDLTLSELRGLISEQYKFCSRSSFYRYVERLVALGRLELVNINGIERVRALSQMPPQ